MKTQQQTNIERETIGRIWTASRAMEQLVALCDPFGGRFAGSVDERAAGDYLLAQAREFGLVDGHAEPFHYQGWQRGPSAIEVVEPVTRAIDAIGLPGSPPCDLQAELIDGGDGEEDDYAPVADRLRGTVVLCNAESSAVGGKPSSHRRDKYLRAVSAGAAAFLYVSRNPGMLAVTGGLASAAAAPIPGFGLSYEIGALLRRALARGVVVLHLRAAHAVPEVESRNVVAELPGNDDQADAVLIGAHYDAHDIAQGAGDNGSGTVTLLELARVLGPISGQLRRRIRFVWFGSEEMGLLGAWRYARGHRADRIACMLNFDSVVAGPAGGQRIHCGNSPALAAELRATVADRRLDAQVDEQLSSSSDHFPFVTLGIPVAAIGVATERTGLVGRGWGHTTADTVDKIDPVSLQVAATVAVSLLLRLAQAETLPPRLDETATRAVLSATRNEAAMRRGEVLLLSD